ncbi:hypothetical protein D082_34650 [Synechocystis sp. PCC 6714]|nr:hypothetical protein D082_34650 [Synechocystis sp. PCC 6714]
MEAIDRTFERENFEKSLKSSLKSTSHSTYLFPLYISG